MVVIVIIFSTVYVVRAIDSNNLESNLQPQKFQNGKPSLIVCDGVNVEDKTNVYIYSQDGDTFFVGDGEKISYFISSDKVTVKNCYYIDNHYKQ